MAGKPPAHYLLTVSGSLAGGEIFQTGFKGQIAVSGTPHIPTTAELASMLANDTDGGTWASNLLGIMIGARTSDSITGVTISYIDATGKTVARADRSFSVVPTSNPGIQTNQSSIVATLLTDVPGALGRGRMYLPGTGCSVSNTTAKLASPNNTTMVTNTLALLHKWIQVGQAIVSSSITTVVVASSGGAHSSPMLNTVKYVKVGDVIDTQRRRRNRLKELYAVGTV